MIHPLSDVANTNIGNGTNIWQFCVVLPDAIIGSECNICSHCFIENKVRIGNNVTIKCGVQIWDGTTIEDNVFIGPNVTFFFFLHPISKNKTFNLQEIVIRKGASIGANATILPGVEIGEYAVIGAGAIITKSVKSYELIRGKY